MHILNGTYKKMAWGVILLAIMAVVSLTAITNSIARAATVAAQNAQVEDSKSAVGEDLYIEEGEVVKGDATVTDGDMTVDGEVHGNVVVVQGNAYINGKVTGDVSVMGGNATLAAGSSVSGNVLVLAGGKVEREEGATVGGEISTVSIPLLPVNAATGLPSDPNDPGNIHTSDIESAFFDTMGRVATLVLVLGLGLLLLVFVLAFALVAPTRLQVSSATLEAVPGPSIAVGLIVAFLIWPAFGFASMILTLTIVGIALVPVLGILVGLVLLFGLANVSLWLGRRVYESVRQETNRPLQAPQRVMLETLLGLGVVLAATLFPTLLLPGWISGLLWGLVYLAACIGVGAGVMSRFGTLVPPTRRPTVVA